MTEQEARKLKIGDKVLWPDGTKGTVVDQGYVGISIAWEDKQHSIIQFDNTGHLRDQLKKAA